ncbi:hypothetical protein [Mannheimia varigena]|uniref:hypothetical protein n=1 Tax=Mannheimia varigena TaxID=85404 RepID=UPI0015B4B4D9|nr:hypothetical protein [Mannheimia varigena]QLD33150.1 hypothetical protein A6B42_04950 [Mannheimia varigena]
MKHPHPDTTKALIAYNKSRSVDWDNVDWKKDNYTLSQELNRAYDTVAKQRYLRGKARLALTKKTRADKGQKKPQLAKCGIKAQPIGTEAAKKSPKSGKFETNIHAKRWRLTRDDGAFWIFDNLYHFVRGHSELFLPNDVVWKRQGGKRGTGGEYCNATAGLLNTVYGNQKKWKGWVLRKISE